MIWFVSMRSNIGSENSYSYYGNKAHSPCKSPLSPQLVKGDALSKFGTVIQLAFMNLRKQC